MKPQRVSKDIKALLELSLQDDLIISQPLTEFLAGWNEDMSDNAIKQITKAMRTKQRDRSASWSASQIGKCKRRQELTFLGMPTGGTTDTHLQMIFLKGTWEHLRFQALLLTAKLLDTIELTVKKPSQRIRCSIDGAGTATVGRYEGREFGFEFKSRNDFQFSKQVMLGIDPQTEAQVDFMFWLSGFDLWVVMNENKNTQVMKEWVFTRNDERIRDIQATVRELNKAIDIQYLHPMIPECKKQLKNGEFYSCPFGGKGGACLASGNYPSSIR